MEGRYTATNTERLRFMDAHIHLDGYGPEQQPLLEQSLEAEELDGVIAVSMDAASCREVQRWAERYPGRVHPAYGFHPEQPLPSEQERSALLQWMDERRDAMIAIGEVGLPYYMRQPSLAALIWSCWRPSCSGPPRGISRSCCMRSTMMRRSSSICWNGTA